MAESALPMPHAVREWGSDPVPADPGGMQVHTCLLTGKCGLAYGRHVADVLFKALVDPTRRAILDELRERNDQTLFELCTRLTMKHGLGSSRQAISQHLDVLEEAGLVTTRREGRYKFHSLDTSPLRAIGERWPVNDER